jgi:hypothetical protein
VSTCIHQLESVERFAIAYHSAGVDDTGFYSRGAEKSLEMIGLNFEFIRFEGRGEMKKGRIIDTTCCNRIEEIFMATLIDELRQMMPRDPQVLGEFGQAQSAVGKKPFLSQAKLISFLRLAPMRLTSAIAWKEG